MLDPQIASTIVISIVHAKLDYCNSLFMSIDSASAFSRKRNVSLDGESLEHMDRFPYLGALIKSDGRCETEVETRIGMAKNAFNQEKELLSKNLNKDIKKEIIKAIILRAALYASETWTYRKEDIRRLEAFEMWVWRKMEKISWRDMKTNEEVLQMEEEERSLVEGIWRRKKNWTGHILRGESLLREVIEGVG